MGSLFKRKYGYASESDRCKLLWQWRGFPFCCIQKIEIADPIAQHKNEKAMVLYGVKILKWAFYFRKSENVNWDLDPWDLNEVKSTAAN